MKQRQTAARLEHRAAVAPVLPQQLVDRVLRQEARAKGAPDAKRRAAGDLGAEAGHQARA